VDKDKESYLDIWPSVAQVMGFDTNIDSITASSGLALAETRPAMDSSKKVLLAGCISLAESELFFLFYFKINTRPSLPREEGTLFDEVGFTIRKCGLEGVSSRARRSNRAWHHSCSGGPSATPK
jgi:hypothetical protein